MPLTLNLRILVSIPAFTIFTSFPTALIAEERSSIDSFPLNAIDDDELKTFAVETSDVAGLDDAGSSINSEGSLLNSNQLVPSNGIGGNAVAPQGASDLNSSIQLSPPAPIYIDKIPDFRGQPWK